jgi:excinuclease ABC subunit C
MSANQELVSQVKKLPALPGVYLFKDDHGEVLYIGKAKNLKKRGSQYIQSIGSDVKVDSIFASSALVEHRITETELEALLLEAKLVQLHQPRFNVLLKSGQPFVYLFIPSSSLPELKIVRNQKQKGTYVGPFLEKGAARKVYDFLVKTFHLKLCKKKIENGCLFYHMGLCAGACRPDFDKKAYLQRLDFAKQSLLQGHKKFLADLKARIAEHNKRLEFEKSRELHAYHQAFERVFESMEQKPVDVEHVSRADIWILTEDQKELFVFAERSSVLKKKRVFYFPFDVQVDQETLAEYFLSFYRTYIPPATILVNFELGDDVAVYQDFLREFHHKTYPITIQKPVGGHFAALIRLGLAYVQQERVRQHTLPRALKMLLKLPIEPHTIDCFDISHTQGRFMVGSCVRFKDGQPDKANFRHFHIKTLTTQDDYAALREIVFRRYHSHMDELPDLILIDGGKGQLHAVADLFPQTEFASLAKKEETVFSLRLPEGKILDQKSHAGQVLIALRDYAHHFAITFHRATERAEL